ncbi:uncharacterized protein [Miscanthus floridulus]|uniref:uncharacterized protein isoform X1 n=1 Tax=Miscanthus floridulus TaxID=154761 RepID=UPI003457B183
MASYPTTGAPTPAPGSPSSPCRSSASRRSTSAAWSSRTTTSLSSSVPGATCCRSSSSTSAPASPRMDSASLPTPADMSRCNALIVAQCLMNRHCVCFVANYVRLVGNHACCRTGKCQNHALQCGAGIGIFLLVRKTTILLQRSARLAFWPSLYLDSFGEEPPSAGSNHPGSASPGDPAFPSPPSHRLP